MEGVPSSESVLTHLHKLRGVYETIRYMNKFQLHQFLLLQEEYYVKSIRTSTACDNICSLVHELRPQKYKSDMTSFIPPIFLTYPVCFVTAAVVV
jgi:hypothetical protein